MTDQWAITESRAEVRARLKEKAHHEGIRMIQNRLRLYCGPEAATTTSVAETKHDPETITIEAGEVFGWLADAAKHNRAWLRDFEDDKVTISTDLYEVILAYQHFRRPSA